MKFTVKTGGGVGFARKENYEYDGKTYEADLKEGDKVKILDAGTREVGKFGQQDNFKIMTRNGEKKLSFNQSTINVLVQEFGEDSESWIGKEARVILQKKVIGGKKCIVSYLVSGDWEINEWGELSCKSDKVKKEKKQYLDGVEVGSNDEIEDINANI